MKRDMHQVRINGDQFNAVRKISIATGLPVGIVVIMAMESGIKAIAAKGSIAGEALGFGPVEIRRKKEVYI